MEGGGCVGEESPSLTHWSLVATLAAASNNAIPTRVQ